MQIIQKSLSIKALDETGVFEGYGSVFDVVDSDRDVIKRGAFAESITKKMPKMLWQHDHRQLIGKFTEAREDEKGLYVKGKLILDVQQGREAYALMKEGVLDGMSVGFNLTESVANKSHGRDIEKADLWEISLVTWGANADALISNVKSASQIDNIRDFEKFLRDAGFSRNEAKSIASCGYKNQRDVDEVEAIKTLINKFK